MLRTGRRGFETTCSPSSASIAVSGRNVAVIVSDNIAPSVPTGLTATAISSSQINLSWSASTDTGGSGLAGYRVYRDGSGTPLVQQSGTTYSDTGLTASTLYSYRVSAYDNQGNESAQSSAQSATTASSGSFVPPGSIIFQSDFSSFENGAVPSGGPMGWAPNINDQAGSYVRYSTDVTPPGGGKTIKFHYADAELLNGNLAELRWNVGSFFREFTLEYWILIPSNYQCRNAVHPPEDPSSNNNKWFRLSPWVDPAAGAERLGMSTERVSDFNVSMAPEWDDPTDSGGMTQRGTFASNFITTADIGQWMKFMFYGKAPTALGGSGRAVLKGWKNDVLIINETPNIYSAGAPHAYRYGYLLGATNGWLGAGTTDFHLANMTCWGNP